MTAPRGFRQYFIFVYFWTGELRIVLRHARKHIDAFSDIDSLSVQQDSICPALQSAAQALCKAESDSL